MNKISQILLIDDDEINNFINQRLLTSLEIAHSVKVFKNGQEALDHLKESCGKQNICPELILLDQNMPVMDGFEFVEEFKKLDFKNKDEIVIQLLSAASEPANKERFDELGIAGFLIKPLTRDKLMEIYKKHFIYI